MPLGKFPLPIRTREELNDWFFRHPIELYPKEESDPELTLINERLAELEARDRESLPTSIKAQLRYLQKKIDAILDKKKKDTEEYV